jgi:hypothetical protein
MIWPFFRRKKAEPPRITLTASIHVAEEAPELTEARYSATAHAQGDDYAAAVADLERVRDMETAGGGEPQSHSEIRRAKYLQKAGRGPEGWRIFEDLRSRHRDNLWVAIDVLDAMRLHLQREGEAGKAVAYGVAHRLARVKLYREMKAEAEAALAGSIESYGSERLEDMIRRNHHASVELADRWIAELTDPADVERLAKTLSKKAGTPDTAASLTLDISRHIERGTDPFDYLQSGGR